MLAGQLFLLVRRLWRRSEWLCLRCPATVAAAVGALLAGVLYAAMAGLPLPTQRALIMLAAFTLGTVLRRHLHSGGRLAPALLGVHPGGLGVQRFHGRDRLHLPLAGAAQPVAVRDPAVTFPGLGDAALVHHGGDLAAHAPRHAGPGRAAAAALLLPLFVTPLSGIPAVGFDLTLLDVRQGLSAVVRTANHVLIYDTCPAFRSGSDTGAKW